MSVAYVRNIDEKTYAVLKKEANRKGISLSELIRQILSQHVCLGEVEAIDQKYRTFVQEQIALYRMDQEQIRQLIKKNERLYLQIMEKMERRWDE